MKSTVIPTERSKRRNLHKRDADDYNTRVYPEVLKTLAKTIDGTPRVQTFETVVSTSHNVPAAA